MPDRQELIDRLKAVPVVINESTTSAAGLTLPYYIDIRRAYGNTDLLLTIAEHLYEKIDPRVNCIAGEGYGGLPLALTLALRYGYHFTMVRGQIKDHGTQSLIEAYTPESDDLVAIVDDTTTTGRSLLKVVEKLESTEARIVGCYSVVSRGEVELPYPHHYLIKAEELLG